MFGLGPRSRVERVRRAGLVHDLGRLGVSNAIWDKPGRVTPAEQERVRLHPYFTRAHAGRFAPRTARQIAIQHHERLEAPGYPRGVWGDHVTPSGRVLAAADVTAASPSRTAPAPRSAQDGRPSCGPRSRAGRLDSGAAESVLRAAGHRSTTAAGVAGETHHAERSTCSDSSPAACRTRRSAKQLVISRKTARNHVEHIYTKIGVSNRARASVFAMKHGLMSDTDIIENS